MKLFCFDEKNHNKAVYDYCMNRAIENKKWAENKVAELNGNEWEKASEVSKQILKEYFTKPLKEMAEYNYKYLRLRSHSFGRYSAFPIDPQAFKLWTELTGKEPQPITF